MHEALRVHDGRRLKRLDNRGGGLDAPERGQIELCRHRVFQRDSAASRVLDDEGDGIPPRQRISADEGRREKEGRRDAVRPEDGEGLVEVVAVTIVEGQQDGRPARWLRTMDDLESAVEVDDGETALEVADLPIEFGGGGGEDA